MAASYSSFLSTKYYSPVFNTALFDGPFRIYFSQAYEGAALKIYHLLQGQHSDLWKRYKAWSEKSKQHMFVLIYPSEQDLGNVIDSDLGHKKSGNSFFKLWDEGGLFITVNPTTDESFKQLMTDLVSELTSQIENYEAGLSEVQIPFL